MSAIRERNRIIRYVAGLALAVLLAGLQSCKVQTVSSRKSAVTSPEWTYDVGNRAGKESVPARTAELLAEARKWLGTKYRYGGHSRSGTDCSGMIMELFQKVYGLKLPRSSAQQREYCSNIGRDELQAGDLMFFDTSKGRRGVSHVGLYMGNGEMIHASSSRGVIISRIDERYYTDKYHSSGRVLASSPKKTDTEGGGKTRVKSAAPVSTITIQPPVRYTEPEVPLPSIEAPAEMPTLDDVINYKIDSIYSSMMD